MWVLVGLWAMSGVRVLLEVRGLTGFEGSTLGGGSFAGLSLRDLLRALGTNFELLAWPLSSLRKTKSQSFATVPSPV